MQQYGRLSQYLIGLVCNSLTHSLAHCVHFLTKCLCGALDQRLPNRSSRKVTVVISCAGESFHCTSLKFSSYNLQRGRPALCRVVCRGFLIGYRNNLTAGVVCVWSDSPPAPRTSRPARRSPAWAAPAPWPAGQSPPAACR